jgi:hypothetical protein
MVDQSERIRCRTYTHARRHPMVLGRIAGWTPPVQLSVTQIIVLLASLGAAVRTWQWWAAPLPDAVALVAVLGIPVVLTWAARRVRVEGRSLPRAVLGTLALWAVPRDGIVAGRPCRERRATTWDVKWMVVIADRDPRP